MIGFLSDSSITLLFQVPYIVFNIFIFTLQIFLAEFKEVIEIRT